MNHTTTEHSQIDTRGVAPCGQSLAPEEHGQADSGLQERKLVADTLAHPTAEWDKGEVCRHLIGVQRAALRLRPA